MSDLSSTKWNSMHRVDRLMLLNRAGIDFIEVGMESYPTVNDHHTDSAYQAILSQKLNEFAGSNFNSLPAPIQNRVTEAFKDQISEAEDEEGDFDIEGDVDDSYVDSDGNDFSYKDTDEDVDDEEKATEAYHYSLYTQISPDGISQKNLRKAREILKDETDRFYEKFFETLGEVEYPYKKDVPVTRPDNSQMVGKYNSNPNEGLYDTKQFTKGGSNTRIGEVGQNWWEKHIEGNEDLTFAGRGELNTQQDVWDAMSESSRLDVLREAGWGDSWDLSELKQFARSNEFPRDLSGLDVSQLKRIAGLENAEDYNIYDELKTDKVKEEDYSDEPESEDAKIAEVDDVGFPDDNEIDKKKEEGTLNEWEEAEEEGDVQPELGDTYDGKSDKTYGEEAVIPYSQENYIQTKIVERKLAGYPDHSIAREVAIWHDLSNEEALDQVQAVEVSVDDKTAYSLFGKRFNQINKSELSEMKTLCGEVNVPKED